MKKSFGAFLSVKRVSKDISLRNFSMIIGISPEYLSKIENNLRPAPSVMPLLGAVQTTSLLVVLIGEYCFCARCFCFS